MLKHGGNPIVSTEGHKDTKPEAFLYRIAGGLSFIESNYPGNESNPEKGTQVPGGEGNNNQKTAQDS